MYPVGATISEAVDNIFLYIILVSVALLLLVTFLMIWFAIKYNRKRHPEPKPVKEKAWLEILWTVIPTLLVLSMFYYGYEGFKLMRTVPEDAMTVHVTGRMWDWKFEYANGKVTDELYVPVDQSVKLLMKSLDVIHSFYIPSHRVKEDVVPGRETYLWFKPQTVGPADIFCAEFCGQRHAYMLSKVNVMEEADFKKWYASEVKVEVHPVVAMMEELGCLDCHSMDASEGNRLSLKDLFGKKRIVIVDGKEKEITIDEAYLLRSIIEPSAEIVKGQDDAMELPDEITKEQINQIVQYLKTGGKEQKIEAKKEEEKKEENK
jgi:cytochrome c oxidase subunit II